MPAGFLFSWQGGGAGKAPSIDRPDSRRREFDEVVVRVAEIQARAAALHPDHAFDGNALFFQMPRPVLLFPGGDGEGQMQVAVAVVRRDRAARRLRRLRGRPFLEEQQYLLARNPHADKSLVAEQFFKSQHGFVEADGSLQIAHIQRGFEYPIHRGHRAFPFPQKSFCQPQSTPRTKPRDDCLIFPPVSDTIPITSARIGSGASFNLMELPNVFDPFVRDLVEKTLRPAEAAEPSGEIPAPFFMDEPRGIRLYQGDAMDLLRRARAETFDLIFADPPYFLSAGGITCQSGKMVSVDKGMWDRPTTFEAVHEFNLEWLRECRRLLRPNGTLWVSGTMHNIYSVGFALQTLGYKVLNDIAWYKVNPPPNLACRYFAEESVSACGSSSESGSNPSASASRATP